MTENEARLKAVNTFIAWLGWSESNGKHRKIVDIYNSRIAKVGGYKLKYSDAWCAASVTAVGISLGWTDIILPECSCNRMIDLYKKVNRWIENDAYVPKAGDLIMYDWDDNGVGDNKGTPDHVGMVVSVTGNTIKVIEGNMSNKVGYRNMTVNGRYIRGYCIPNYAAKATGSSSSVINTEFKVGDVVNYTDDAQYSSSNAILATRCKGGTATITAISNGRHPYHLIRVAASGATVYGWVNSGTFTKVSSGNATTTVTTPKVETPKVQSTVTATTSTDKVHIVASGDNLWSIAVKYYDNGSKYTEIMKSNNLKNTLIHVGDKLIIPKL